MYKIKSTSLENGTINIFVEYTLTDGSVTSIWVPVFMPSSKEDVLLALRGREETEESKLNARKLNVQIKDELDKDIVD